MDMPSSPWREIIWNLSLEEVERRVARYKSQLTGDDAQVLADLHFGAGVLAKFGFLRAAAAIELAADRAIFTTSDRREVGPVPDVAPEHAEWIGSTGPARQKTSGHWVVRRPTPREPHYTAIYYRHADDPEVHAGLRLHAPSITLLRDQVLAWFGKQALPARCTPRDPFDHADIIETWE